MKMIRVDKPDEWQHVDVVFRALVGFNPVEKELPQEFCGV
jgi:hypothetical protein